MVAVKSEQVEAN